tara:strand:+ start:303 stop:512 length:210 start_codon:yes stop_codon:yes gene_type:complete
MQTDVENYLNVRARVERIEDIIGGFTMEYNCEKLMPLLNDGFEQQDLIDYFAIKLAECAAKQELKAEEE